MQLEDLIDREAIIAGVARGLKDFLHESGAGAHLAEAVEMLGGLHLLKEGLLTADQVCRLYQISRRKFDRMVANTELRKEEALGKSEPRFFLFDVLALLQKHHVKAKADPETPGATLLNVLDMPGSAPRRRQRKAA